MKAQSTWWRWWPTLATLIGFMAMVVADGYFWHWSERHGTSQDTAVTMSALFGIIIGMVGGQACIAVHDWRNPW